VYFHNQAEAGVSIGRRLVEVVTSEGSFCLNSLGEAFVHDVSGSEAVTSGSDGSATSPVAFKALRLLGRW
jgi:hypothetical protein